MPTIYFQTGVVKQIPATFFTQELICGNYDGDDETCDDYDPDEDLHMMFVDDDYREQTEG